MEVVVSSESAIMAIENLNPDTTKNPSPKEKYVSATMAIENLDPNTTKNPSPKEKYAPAIENLDPNTTKIPSPKEKYVPVNMATENLDPNTTKNPSPKEKYVPAIMAIENLDPNTAKNPSPKEKYVPVIVAIENLDPNTTKNPSPKEKYVPAIRAKSGDEEGFWKEKKILYGGNDYASKKSTTVTRDSHYFQNPWTFWFDNPFSKSSQATWGNSLRSLYTFVTIEEFWSVYNNMHSPSIWIPGADLYCFKDKIEPKWEDPICANGGKWTMMVSRVKLESNWLNTLLALVGEQFEQGDEICGAVLNFRARGDKISLWTKNAANEKAQLSIGKQWKELLGCNETIGFIVHEDAKTLDRDAKHRYTV